MIMISVIIATYNRSEDLKLALGCYLNQISAADIVYEVIVIDNNSTDATKAVVESFMPAFSKKLRYFFEPRQGQSFAHNRGIQEAKGEIIVLGDDDVTVEYDYLENVYDVFKKYGNSIGFVGGKIEPRWADCKKPEWFDQLSPEWLKEFFWGPLAILDYGDKTFALDRQTMAHPEWKLFYGANMAIRKELFEKYGPFNVQKTVSQDTELQLRFLNQGEKGLYAPQLKVFHKVSPGRLTAKYYYRWYFLRGTLFEIQQKYQKKFYHPFGIQFAFIVQTLNLFIKSAFARSYIQKVHQRCQGFFNLGQMTQMARHSSQ